MDHIANVLLIPQLTSFKNQVFSLLSVKEKLSHDST